MWYNLNFLELSILASLRRVFTPTRASSFYFSSYFKPLFLRSIYKNSLSVITIFDLQSASSLKSKDCASNRCSSNPE